MSEITVSKEKQIEDEDKYIKIPLSLAYEIFESQRELIALLPHSRQRRKNE